MALPTFWLRVLVALFCYSQVAQLYKATRLAFQQDRRATTDSYLHYIGPDVVLDLKEVTVCFRLFVQQGRDIIPIISYAKEDFDNEMIVRKSRTNNYEEGVVHQLRLFQFQCCSEAVKIEVPFEYPFNRWLSACWAVNIPQNTFEFWVNGKNDSGYFKTEKSSFSGTVRAGGSLVIGQDQDKVMGGFNKYQSVVGYIADLRIYQGVQNSNDMELYTKCLSSKFYLQPILELANVTSIFVNVNVFVDEIEVNETLCNIDASYDLIFPELRTFQETVNLCHGLGGSLKIPINEVENHNLFNFSKSYANRCNLGYTDFLWLGMQYNHLSKEVVAYDTHQAVNYSNILKSKINYSDKSDTCVTFNGSPDDVPTWFATWQTRICNSSRCSLCHFAKPTMMAMRGLCAKSYFDRKYFVTSENDKLLYIGEYYSAIRFVPAGHSAESGVWELIRYDLPDVKAFVKISAKDLYPTGLKNWVIKNDICDQQNVQLKLTICTSNEFTCNDGTCISMTNRCNNKVNCDDGTDEESCDLVIVPHVYSSRISPPTESFHVPLPVKIQVNILRVKSIELTEFQFVVEMVVIHQWFDNRLMFRNLKNDSNMNKFSVDRADNGTDIWIPEIDFIGAEFTSCDVVERFKDVRVVKKAPPLEDDLKNVDEDDIFQGADNPLQVRQQVTVKASCQFDFSNFPFDRQSCFLLLQLTSVNAGDVVLERLEEAVTYQGNRRLLEYYVYSELISFETTQGIPASRVTLVFQNLVTNQMGTTFAPTLILLIIGCFTFLFHLGGFNDRITVALTSLLVEASFFSQVNISTPNTAYLKLVDVWFVFCIFVLFLIVVALVIINCFVIKSKEYEKILREMSFLGNYTNDENKTAEDISRTRPTSNEAISSWTLEQARMYFGQGGRIVYPDHAQVNTWLNNSERKPITEKVALPHSRFSNAGSKTTMPVTSKSPCPVPSEMTANKQRGEVYLRRAMLLNRASVVGFPCVIVLFLSLYGYLAWKGLTSTLDETLQ